MHEWCIKSVQNNTRTEKWTCLDIDSDRVDCSACMVHGYNVANMVNAEYVYFMCWFTSEYFLDMPFILWMQWSKWWSISIWCQLFLASSYDGFICMSGWCICNQGCVDFLLCISDDSFSYPNSKYCYFCGRNLFSLMVQNALRFVIKIISGYSVCVDIRCI